MEDLELKQMWRAYDQKLDKLLVLNLHYFEQLQTQKAKNKLNAFMLNHAVWIGLGLLWVGVLAFLVLNTLQNLWFTISVGSIILFSAYATILYIKHIAIISQININGNITETQEKLASIRLSLNKTGRVLLLQSPFYCTWFINPTMYNNVVAMSVTLGIAALLAVISVWAYRSLAPKKIQPKWVRNFEKSLGASAIVEATDFLGEIDAFKKENI